MTVNHAAHQVRRTVLAEGIAALDTQPVLPGDYGATRKATKGLASHLTPNATPS